MAIAKFFRRAAVAASQVVAGFDEDEFRRILEDSPVGLAIGERASESQEGRTAADLAVRLLARLYPTLNFRIANSALSQELEELALSINPEIEFVDSAEVGLVIGSKPLFPESMFIGATGWRAGFSSTKPQEVGQSGNPFGAGVAACLGVANLFRRLFVPAAELDGDVSIDVWAGNRVESEDLALEERSHILTDDCTVVGLGAIGNGTVWALSRCAKELQVHLVDHEVVEVSNLQRYVLANGGDVGTHKTEIAQRFFKDGVARVHSMPWDRYIEASGYRTQLTLVALDSARDRRSVQASLPKWVLNAWTQPGDLGVSIHSRFARRGACLACLYMPEGPVQNEDEVVAAALGVPERQEQVRELSAEGAPVPDDLLTQIGQALQVDPNLMLKFRGSTLQNLYSQGLCGGALVPLDRLGAPRNEMHVPLAHQSTLAGLLLAAAAVRTQSDHLELTEVIRVNVLSPIGYHLRQPMQKLPEGCYCSDSDFVDAYEQKWGDTLTS